VPKIKDAKDLTPIVEAKIKTMYKGIKTIKIKDTRLIDGNWFVRADAKDNTKVYTVRIDITPDGVIKNAEETGRLLMH
jgi:hypothetical protein